MYSTPFSMYFAIMNFVINRKFQLKIEGIPLSYEFMPLSSVPQGSHCGPLLFNIYTADLNQCVTQTNNNILTFADDTKFFAVVNNLEQQLQLQQSIDRLYLWSKENSIELNVSKTFSMSFAKKRQIKFKSRYYILNEVITSTDSIKDLGVQFDSDMSFSTHKENLITKSNRISAMSFKFSREINNPSLNIKLIRIYLMPILEYCSILWQPISKTMDSKLERSQRFATRIALHSPYRTDHPMYLSYDQRLCTLDMLTFAERRSIAIVILTKKITYDYLECTLQTQLRNCLNLRTITRSPQRFIVPGRLHDGPLKTMMTTTNYFSKITNIETDSFAQIKAKLRKEFLHRRTIAT